MSLAQRLEYNQFYCPPNPNSLVIPFHQKLVCQRLWFGSCSAPALYNLPAGLKLQQEWKRWHCHRGEVPGCWEGYQVVYLSGSSQSCRSSEGSTCSGIYRSHLLPARKLTPQLKLWDRQLEKQKETTHILILQDHNRFFCCKYFAEKLHHIFFVFYTKQQKSCLNLAFYHFKFQSGIHSTQSAKGMWILAEAAPQLAPDSGV